MDSEKIKISTTTDGKPADPGFEEAGAPKPINPETGQHRAYWVLSEEERQKGFVRPVRDAYVHVGPKKPKNLRDLTLEESKRYAEYGYVKFEEYPKGDGPTGRFWTQSELNNIGCGAVTTMGRSIAETYARDPKYYGSTFCTLCKKHLPVEEFEWDDDGTVVGS